MKLRWTVSASVGNDGFVQARLLSDKVEAEVVRVGPTNYYIEFPFERTVPLERYQSLEQAKAVAVARVRFHHADKE